MGHVDDVGFLAAPGQVRQRVRDRVEVRGGEAGVVEERAQDVDAQVGGAQVREGGGEVLAVLTAPGVGRIGAGDQDEDAAGPEGERVAQGVDGVGVPVAVAPQDRQGRPAPGELGREGVAQGEVLGVDGAAPAQVVVVLGDLFEPFVGDRFALDHVAQERHHVPGLVRAPEGAQEERVVGG